MPGYNHHSNCMCGWCVANGKTFDRAAHDRETRRRTAADFLRRNGATRLGSSCFVAPNAVCPVCKASVYFYANSSGSRVFFDDLGPPWPKHPCTERPQDAARVLRYANRPERRKIGLIKDIVGQARLVDRSKAPNIDRAERPTLEAWRLLVITNARFKADSIVLEADFVETIHQHQIKLTTSIGPLFYVGQFISLCHDTVSFFDEVLGEHRAVDAVYEGMKPSKAENPSFSVRAKTTVNLDEFGLPVGLKTEGVPGRAQRSHYIGSDPENEFFQTLKRFVLASAKDGALYLADFLIALNDSEFRTLLSAGWTRELVSAILYDIRNEDFLRNTHFATERLTTPKKSQLDLEKIATDLREVEGRIAELELAWDDAITAVQRQKMREQIDSARRKRSKLFGMLSA